MEKAAAPRRWARRTTAAVPAPASASDMCPLESSEPTAPSIPATTAAEVSVDATDQPSCARETVRSSSMRSSKRRSNRRRSGRSRPNERTSAAGCREVSIAARYSRSRSRGVMRQTNCQNRRARRPETSSTGTIASRPSSTRSGAIASSAASEATIPITAPTTPPRPKTSWPTWWRCACARERRSWNPGRSNASRPTAHETSSSRPWVCFAASSVRICCCSHWTAPARPITANTTTVATAIGTTSPYPVIPLFASSRPASARRPSRSVTSRPMPPTSCSERRTRNRPRPAAHTIERASRTIRGSRAAFRGRSRPAAQPVL